MKHLIKNIFWINFLFSCGLISATPWIVITSINRPTEAIIKFAQLKDWHVVVVADKKTPADWSLEGCEFLSVEKQQNLGYRITQFLPWNHYCRKNIGYLYAIQHGATMIYDTDDDNILINDTIEYLPEKTSLLTVHTDSPVLNVYGHFGRPSVWPRGYPLERILEKPQYQLVNESANPLVQQGLVNEDPDVDAIFRLTQGNLFDFQANEPIYLPAGCMCPFNTQNTIIHYDAFWGLLIPITVSFRVCDIWRGYVTQRLLWELGASVCFTSPTAVQKRNPHNLLTDFIDEIDLYVKAGKLVSFLLAWKSDKTTLDDRILDITQALVERNFYKHKELEFVQAWLEDLRDVGYKMPQFS